MAAEEAKKVEVPPVCATEPPPAKVETKAPEEKCTNDTKDVAVVEKPVEAAEEKAAEGSAHRDAELARVATEKKDALIKAWEESERSKVENSAQKKLAAIGAWENSKKAELEAQLKKMEEKLEMKKAKYTEKIKNKIARLHKSAEEKRAITEAKRGESLLKTEEFSSKCRVTGASPKKLLRWFSN
ncbi:remorin [Artemisia annua]|uniref:Remorin n=1 Tax=Artemisia annua TaxID=35608 RepID=A0A2U1PIX7_ARTAN|nr:remorin [Artemisia annua]